MARVLLLDIVAERALRRRGGLRLLQQCRQLRHLLRGEDAAQLRQPLRLVAPPALPEVCIDLPQHRRGELLLAQGTLLPEKAVVLHQQADDALLGHRAAQIFVPQAAPRGLQRHGGAHLAALAVALFLARLALEGAVHLEPQRLGRQSRRLGGTRRVDLALHGVFQPGQHAADLLGIGHALAVVAEVKLPGHLRDAELDAVLAAREEPLERVGAEVFDEVVRVLLCRLTVDHLVRQLQHTDGKLALVEDLQRALRGEPPGVIVVVAEHKLLRVAAEKPRLLDRQRRSHRRHGIVEARLMERHDVEVSLAEDDVRPLRLFREVQPVEHTPLAVGQRLGRVHVFRLGLVEHAAAEADNVAPHIDHREHEPVAELVV